MSELYSDIEEQLVMGASPFEVAKHFKVSLSLVYQLQEDLHLTFSNISYDCQQNAQRA
jgi:hypothetical protein